MLKTVKFIVLYFPIYKNSFLTLINLLESLQTHIQDYFNTLTSPVSVIEKKYENKLLVLNISNVLLRFILNLPKHP